MVMRWGLSCIAWEKASVAPHQATIVPEQRCCRLKSWHKRGLSRRRCACSNTSSANVRTHARHGGRRSRVFSDFFGAKVGQDRSFSKSMTKLAADYLDSMFKATVRVSEL